YFGPPPERPPTSSDSFHASTPMTLPAATPISGHGIPHMLPCRPDIPAINWRPA
ncbi:Hypothetical predicted protein, partial [Olea europaea subsp. europaea]